MQIFDFGHHTDGSAYIVMELLDGEPLDKRLKRQGTLSIQEALRIMRQVSGSLGAAHARGIVHRDLKPENIYLVRDPEVLGGERAKILDFGIAKLGGDQAVKTNTSAVMGTPTYMSPEQCRGAGGVDQRSDVYALGCVVFTLITGRPPFDADGIGDIIAMHLREPAPVPSSRLASVPREIDQLILTCLAKDPAHRFASATALSAALGSLVTTLSGTGSALPAAGSAHFGSMQSSLPTTLSGASGISMAVPDAKRSRTGMIVALTAVVLVGGGITALAVNSKSGGSAPPVTRPVSVAAAAAAAAPIVAPPSVDTAPAPIDPHVALTASMKQVLGSFVAWSKDHAGAPCPDAATFGAVQDPWGQPIQLTCSEQPTNQIAGANLGGPDGKLGTDDDIDSWQLSNDVTAVVRGPHWVVAVAKPSGSHLTAGGAHTVARPAPAKPPTDPGKPAVAIDPPKPAPAKPPDPVVAKPDPTKPVNPTIELDANGFPVKR